MKYSHLFGKTNKSAPHDADSPNARLLIQAGFIDQLGAGIFSYLPLGLRVLKKIQNITREEMNALGAQEVYMPALIPKALWDTTGRWDEIDVNFKLKGHGDKKYALGSTHEEVVTPLIKSHIKSYKDFPVSVYQIQDKYRDEPRAKSGLLRGREFSMKDLYSFHLDEEDFVSFYEKSKGAYLNVFSRCGIEAKVVEASGGVFSKYSHEFQVFTPSGEDLIFHCGDCAWAQNKEIVEVAEGDDCPGCNKGKVQVTKAIEIGNIFPLKTKFSEAFKLKVQGADGKMKSILMGCYGIGMSRLMGSVVEIHHDEKGIIWPKNIAPFQVHLISIGSRDEAEKERILTEAESLYNELKEAGLEVLWDERDTSPGEKFSDADLIGIPVRLVISQKTLAEGSVEWKERHESDARFVTLETIKEELLTFMNEPYETTSHLT